MKQYLMTATAIMVMATSGMALATDHNGQGARGEHKAKIQQALSQLPEEKATLIKTTFKEMRADRKANREAHSQHREEMKALLLAPTFNKSTFVSKAKSMAEKHTARKIAKAEKIANLASQLNAEERKVLIEIMPKRGKHKRRGGGNGDKRNSE